MSALWRERDPLILASNSVIRARILADAGVPAEVIPAGIDERAVEATLSGEAAIPANVALALAAAKALAVSKVCPGRLVLGCDQTLSLDGERFTKPLSREDGRSQLKRLSGATHVLSSGVAIACNEEIVWRAVSEAKLSMRPLSDAFIEAYLDAAGDGVLTSVGGYQFEGVGAHLFEEVDGDFFTILGLPLLPLLAGLRGLGALS